MRNFVEYRAVKVGDFKVNNEEKTDNSNTAQARDRGVNNGTYQKRAPMRNDRGENSKPAPFEVTVDHNIDKAMKILKRKLIKEGLFKELKSRRYYEKPSERRKRKSKESVKKARKEEARNKKNALLF